MSNRIATLCVSTVQQAREREKILVSQGMGTRDWTEEQQRELLRSGVVRDENGEAYQGHHMKSVEAYPAYQGRVDNIQLLSKYEHIRLAHGGNLRNPTNGYYNLQTGQTEPFAEDNLIPCTIIPLSRPICQRQSMTPMRKEDFATFFERDAGNSPGNPSALPAETARDIRRPSAETARDIRRPPEEAARDIRRPSAETARDIRRPSAETARDIRRPTEEAARDIGRPPEETARDIGRPSEEELFDSLDLSQE